MPLSFQQYLGAVQAAMQPPEPAPMQMPADTLTPQGSMAPPPAPAYQSPVGSAAAPMEPTAPAGPPSKFLPPDAFGPGANPIEVGVKLAQSRGDLPPDPAPAAPAPQAGPTQATSAADNFPLVSAGGAGVIPAHEVDLRGPSLKGAQGNYNEAVAGAIDAGTAAHGANAGREFALALEQERGAMERQRAAEVAMAEREEEMAQQQHDFTTSAKALGQFAFKPDGGFWESRTTGQKVAGLFSLALNGFMAGVGRPVPDQIGMAIERSVRAQENAYHALRDKVGTQQNAFSMAMQKYQNADAARAHVRAAALDALQAQAAQVMALNKGTEIGARAAAAYADLEGQKMQQIQQGIRFLPSQVTGRRFVDQRTGLVYSEQEAKAMMAKLDEHAQAEKMKGLDVAGDIVKEREKAQAEKAAYGGLGKAGAQKLAEEQAKTQLEQDANLSAIERAQSNVAGITGGSVVGNAYSKVSPTWAPLGTSTKVNQLDREGYNRRVMMSVGAAYKLSTDANEPKNRAMVEHLAEPYIVEPGDNEEIATAKMGALRKLLTEGAASKGASAPTISKSAGLTFHDGKK